MACNDINSTNWNWKSGDQYLGSIGRLKIPFNYFSCGTYYFDGSFRVVKFPKGMILYHGSGAIANAGVEFPLGKDFYDPEQEYKMTNNELRKKVFEDDEKSIQEILSEKEAIAPSWYSNYKTSELYSLQNPQFSSVCDTKCINTYKLKTDAIFFLLDDNFNIWRLINDPKITPEMVKAITFMYSLTDPSNFENDPKNYGQIYIKNKKRRSFREYDLPFTKWLCENIIKNRYAGYAANANIEANFHLEFAFCNPLPYLVRTIDNNRDWQNLDFSSVNDVIKSFFIQLSYYKTTNGQFHSGDLLEHSVWSLLYAEQIALRFSKKIGMEAAKKIASIAFLHDIGKMDPSKCLKRKHDMVYFALPDHPRLGGDYVRKTKPLPVLDENMNIVDNFNMDALLFAFGLEPQDVEIAALVIDHHWDFGYFLSRWDGKEDNENVQGFIDTVSEGKKMPELYYFVLITVSVADILATQPYGMNNLTAELNHRSYFFPFISNMPKKYKGTTLADKTEPKRNAFAELILKIVAK